MKQPGTDHGNDSPGFFDCGGHAMKRTALLLVAAALASILAGCGPINSLQPLYTKEDKVFEGTLLGEWQPKSPENDEDKKARWTFEKSGNEYFYTFCMTTIEKKGCLRAQARLVRLGGAIFVDFEGDTRDDEEASKIESMPFPIISTHMIGRIWIEKDAVRIHMLEDSWVDKRIKEGKFALTYTTADGGTVLTAKTEDLRQFAQDRADDEEAFSGSFELVRAK
jgi:hypothetical protein